MKGLLSLFLLLTFPTFAHAVKDVTLFIQSNSSDKNRWYDENLSETQNLNRLVTFLRKSNLGSDLLSEAQNKARSSNLTLTDVLKVGENSLTDTTLIRRFQSTEVLNIQYETKTFVYINKELPFVDAILDLAHEITHYIYRTPFNPYTPKLTPLEFIKSTIEGEGGEVDAYLSECRVLYELFDEEVQNRFLCGKILENNTFSKTKAINEFYKVGPYLNEIKKHLREFELSSNDLDRLSGETPLFISSAYGSPYPLSAIEEYKTVMQKACDNDHQRIELLKNSSDMNQRKIYRRLEQNYFNRCSPTFERTL